VRCIEVLYSKPFENFIAPHTTEYRYTELREVLNRRKFDKYLELEERQKFLIKFVNTSRRILIQETISICRDAKDNKFLELAVNGDAQFIITGDQDLLVLNPFRGIKIITPEILVSEFRNLRQDNNI